jgi:hypothetical protein
MAAAEALDVAGPRWSIHPRWPAGVGRGDDRSANVDGDNVANQWFIRCKRRVRGFDPDEDPNYPAIGRAIKHLDMLARVQGWQPLTSFVSEDPDVALDLLDDDEDLEAVLGGPVPDDEDLEKALARKLGKVRWFKPDDALVTVTHLVEAIEQLPRRLPLQPQNCARVATQLKELQQTLQRLVEQRVLFRFYAEFG